MSAMLNFTSSCGSGYFSNYVADIDCLGLNSVLAPPNSTAMAQSVIKFLFSFFRLLLFRGFTFNDSTPIPGSLLALGCRIGTLLYIDIIWFKLSG